MLLTKTIRYVFFSKNKAIYKKLGEDYKLSPFRVYLIAHGKKTESEIEHKVKQELMKLKILVMKRK